MPYLVFDSGSGERIQIPVTASGVRIGRDPSCELPIPSESASRHHATVKLEPGGVTFQDERSHNGSLVNGERVAEALLHDRDEIRIGGFSITYFERDPYGEDSTEMPAVRPEAAPATPREGAARPSGGPPSTGRLPTTAVLIFLAVATLIVMGLAALVTWPLFFGEKSAGATRPAPTAAGSAAAPPSAPAASPWKDAAGFVTVPASPPGFKEAERSDTALKLVGPAGGKFQSTIAITAAASRPGATTGSELALAERALEAELGSGYQRLGAGRLPVGGREALFLMYQRSTPEGVLLQSWLVLVVEEGIRASLSLSSEIESWETVKPAFTALLSQVRFREAPAGAEMPAASP